MIRIERLRDRREFRNGPNRETTCARLTADEHVMRYLVHRSQGWIPRAAPYDVKTLLGIHVHEDAEFVDLIRARRKELEKVALARPVLYRPAPELLEIFDFMDSLQTWEEYVGAVYSVIKPGLIDAWEKHFTTTDPLLDEPTTRLMSNLMRVASQHIGGGIALVESLYSQKDAHTEALHESSEKLRALWSRLPAVPAERQDGETGTASLSTMPPLEHVVRDPSPKRDGGNGPEDTKKKTLHSLLSEELERGEVLAECSHAHPELPWEFHRDMARLAWDQMRHALALEKILRNMGVEWGDYPMDTRQSGRWLAMPLADRLRTLAAQALRCVREGRMCEFGSLEGTEEFYPFLVCGYFRADDRLSAEKCSHWAQWIEGADDGR